MNLTEVLGLIEQAGFKITVVDGVAQIEPAEKLTEIQRQWLRRYSADIVALLLSSDGVKGDDDKIIQ